MRTQLLSEAARLQTIQHPAVVKVLAVGELPPPDARPYLAMERLEGETLASVLARGPLPVAQALALFEDLSGAIGALHDQGLIHRDLEPENVFIVGAQHAVLLDFGIAKELAAPASTTTMDASVRGTPAYMAPERFFGQPAGVATDLYELAVTLYAMLAGQLPWESVEDPEARLDPRPLARGGPWPPAGARHRAPPRAVDTGAESPATRDRVPRGRAPRRGAAAHRRTSALRDRAPPFERGSPRAAIAERAWFAERKSTTDRGRTPLAWAPTEASPPQPRPRARRRWPFVVAGLAVAVAGACVAVRQLGGGETPGAPAGEAARPARRGAGRHRRAFTGRMSSLTIGMIASQIP